MTSSSPVVLCPRRAGDAHRDRLWSFARARWAADFPDWPIIEGHHDDGPFNRSAALNAAAHLAGDEWTSAVLIDADVLLEAPAVRAAVAIAEGTGGPALAYDVRRHLTARVTTRVLEGYAGRWDGPGMLKYELTDGCSSAVVVSRELWDAVGGFDELFSGWGWEDVAFRIACETISGQPLVKINSHLWHLWHPKSPENDQGQVTFVANRDRGNRYKAARWNREGISELVAEHLGRRPTPLPIAHPPALGGIPPILHRTVPTETSSEVDRWWARWAELHPTWVLMDHHDPLDPADWPETGDLWDRCTSGAQRAGLIRLEALWRWGGVYVDSDVEPYRQLDPFLGLEGFAGWEDAKVVPDAVLGAKAEHPAVAIMLERARAAILAGRGAWDSGPGVTTATLPGRDDWLLLPPGSFYPYHYSQKVEGRDVDHAALQPWAHGAHHWHHSWRGR